MTIPQNNLDKYLKKVRGTIALVNGMIEPWLSVHQIAKHLHLSKETVYRLIERQEIPCCRIGKLWVFKASIVDDWVIKSTEQKVKRHINGARKVRKGDR